jgi:poly-gamma-glutamate synthesis protein (capsule biosynthesis protein)
MDHGADAFRETQETVTQAGISVCGVASDPVWKEIRLEPDASCKIAILGVSFHPNNTEFDPLYNIVECNDDLVRYERIIREASQKVDVVVVSVHWGDEFVTSPSPDQIEAASRFAKAGATIQFGHHPHVYQGYTSIDQSQVYYSLGNFITDMNQHYLRVGAMALLNYHLDERKTIGAVIPIRLDKQNRPQVSFSEEDVALIQEANQRLEQINDQDYSLKYKQWERKAYQKYKSAILTDFIKSAIRNPRVSLGIAWESIRRRRLRSRIHKPEGQETWNNCWNNDKTI